MSPLPKTITTRQLADALGMSAWRVYELAREGHIPHVRVKRSILFLEDEVEAWLRSGGSPLNDGDPLE